MDELEIAVVDRIEMDGLLTRYATAIDGLDWDLLDTVFMRDAHLDYRSAGGPAGTYPEVRQWLADVLPLFEITQHLVVNREYKRTADGVRTRSSFLNHNRLRVEGKPWQFTVGGRYFLNHNRLRVEGKPWQFTVGGRYHDRLVRTTDGWRISRRTEETLWWDNPMPGLPDVPYPVAESPAF